MSLIARKPPEVHAARLDRFVRSLADGRVFALILAGGALVRAVRIVEDPCYRSITRVARK